MIGGPTGSPLPADEVRRRLIAEQDHRAYQDEANERLRLQAEIGQGALKGLTLANGGAIVALFTFIGNSPSRKLEHTPLWIGLLLFGSGLALVLATQICAFVSQGGYMKSTQIQAWNAQDDAAGGSGKRDIQGEYRVGERWECAAVAGAVLSLAAFVAGAAFALQGVLP